MTDWKYPQEPNNDPRNAKYIFYDANSDETYICPTEEEALIIAENALEYLRHEEDKGSYIAAITVTPTHKAVIAEEEADEHRKYYEYRIEKIEP